MNHTLNLHHLLVSVSYMKAFSPYFLVLRFDISLSLAITFKGKWKRDKQLKFCRFDTLGCFCKPVQNILSATCTLHNFDSYMRSTTQMMADTTYKYWPLLV